MNAECRWCHETVDVEELVKDSNRKTGRKRHCKKCEGEKQRERYKAEASIRVEKNREYRLRNAEAFKAARKRDQEAYNRRTREWRIKNPEAYRASVKRSNAKQGAKPDSVLRKTLRTRILQAIKSEYKHSSTVELLGCSIAEFRARLESLFQEGMTWENRGVWKADGPMTWHIDHIKPISAFDLSDPVQQKACFHWSNLQPLWAKDNLEKSDTFELP